MIGICILHKNLIYKAKDSGDKSFCPHESAVVDCLIEYGNAVSLRYLVQSDAYLCEKKNIIFNIGSRFIFYFTIIIQLTITSSMGFL